MSFWIYILRCADNSYYTGHTDNLEKRIGEHQSGSSDSYTTGRCLLNWCLARNAPPVNKPMAAEQQINGWSRKKKEAMMRGDWAEVSRLAKGTGRDGEPFHPSTSSGRTGHGR